MAAPRFTERDVAKAVAGAIKGGMEVGRVEVDVKTGRIVIFAARHVPAPEDNEDGWEQWFAEHADDERPPARRPRSGRGG